MARRFWFFSFLGRLFERKENGIMKISSDSCDARAYFIYPYLFYRHDNTKDAHRPFTIRTTASM